LKLKSLLKRRKVKRERKDREVDHEHLPQVRKGRKVKRRKRFNYLYILMDL